MAVDNLNSCICHPATSLHNIKYVIMQSLCALGSNLVMFSSVYLFLKLRSHAQAAKVVALSSVVTGKEVESDAISLHRELESEFFFLSVLSVVLFIFFSPLLSALHYCFCWAAKWIILLKLKCQALRLKINVRATDSSITIINVSSPLWWFDPVVMH